MALRKLEYVGADGCVFAENSVLSIYQPTSGNAFSQTGRYISVPISSDRIYYIAFVSHDSDSYRHYAIVAESTTPNSTADYADTTVKTDGVKTVISYTCTWPDWKYLFINSQKDNDFIGVWEAKLPTAADIDITDCILDRGQSDVYNLNQIKKNIMKNGYHAFTTIDDAEGYAEYLNGHRGAYNCTDLNRVGSIVIYLSQYLGDCITNLSAYAASKGVTQTDDMKMPYTAADISGGMTEAPKTDWTYTDIPYADTMGEYLAYISILRGLVPLPDTTPPVPTNLNHMSLDKANAIEIILHDVYYAAMKIYNDAKAAIDAASI